MYKGLRNNLSAVLAHDQDDVIGIGDNLPWNVPADMKYFHEKCEEHDVLIVGYHTYDSLPDSFKEKYKDKIVLFSSRDALSEAKAHLDKITDNGNMVADGETQFYFNDAIGSIDFWLKNIMEEHGEDKRYLVIGGLKTYMDLANFIHIWYVNEIHGSFTHPVLHQKDEIYRYNHFKRLTQNHEDLGVIKDDVTGNIITMMKYTRNA